MLRQIAGEQHQIRPHPFLFSQPLEVIAQSLEQAAGRARPLEAVVRTELQIGQVQQGDG